MILQSALRMAVRSVAGAWIGSFAVCSDRPGWPAASVGLKISISELEVEKEDEEGPYRNLPLLARKGYCESKLIDSGEPYFRLLHMSDRAVSVRCARLLDEMVLLHTVTNLVASRAAHSCHAHPGQ